MSDRTDPTGSTVARELLRLPRVILGPALRFLRSMHENHELSLLRAPVRPVEPRAFRLVERTESAEAVLSAYRTLNRSISLQRIRQRMERGLRFFELYRDNRLVATTWIVCRGTRFVDEIGYHFPIAPDSFWIRDIYVDPEVRGQHLFSSLLDALAAEPFRGCDTAWSDVESHNVSSMKAHQNYGFREVSRIRARRIARIFLIRSREVRGFPDLSGFQVGQMVVFTGPAFARYCRTHLA